MDGAGFRQRKPTDRIKIYLVVGLALVLAALAYRHIKTKAARPGDLAPTPATASFADIPDLSSLHQESLPSTGLTTSNVRESRRVSIRDVFAPLRPLPRGKAGGPNKGRSAQGRTTSLKLRGVIVGGNNSIAIINDKFVHIGELIDGYKVVSIEENQVFLRSGNKTLKLELASNE